MDKEIVNINCTFCGKEIECPNDMLATSKKHMCHLCFAKKDEFKEDMIDVHVDLPQEKFIEETANSMVNDMVKDVFPRIWGGEKTKLKEIPKKELAYEMFGRGAYIALSTMLKLQHELGMKEQEEAYKKNG